MKFSREYVFLGLSVISGACSGAIVAFLIVPSLVQPYRASDFGDATSTRASATSTQVTTSTAPVISLVPVERRVVTPIVPPSFLQRRSSAIATLYKKPKNGTGLDERLLGTDRLLGDATALTSDGWFVTSASVFDGLHMADVVVWEDGVTYPIDRGFIDHLNNTVFFKTSAHDLAAPAFVQSGEVTQNEQVWVETKSSGFVPDVVVDDRARVVANEYSSSETATRRFILSGVAGPADRGGAVWDPNGSLLGVIESKGGETLRLIPASTIADSLASLLANGQIQHAQLGVHALDLATVRFDSPRGTVPLEGALIHVTATTPAGKAKLKNGDVILRVERDILDGTADLGEILADYRPGALVTLRVLRGADVQGDQTSDLDVPVTLGSVVTSEPLK